MSSNSSLSSAEAEMPPDIMQSPPSSPQVDMVLSQPSSPVAGCSRHPISPATSPLHPSSGSSPPISVSSETSSGSDSPLPAKIRKMKSLCGEPINVDGSHVNSDTLLESLNAPYEEMGIHQAALDPAQHNMEIQSVSDESENDECKSNSSVGTFNKTSHSEQSDDTHCIEDLPENEDDSNSSHSSANTSSDDEGTGHDHTLLFNGSDFTKDSAVLSIATLFIKQKWSKISLNKTLKLMKSMLPQPNELPASSYSLFKYIESLAPAPQETIHKYCRRCQIVIDVDLNNCGKCNEACFGQFFEFSIESQVKFLFEQRNLAEIIDTYNHQNNNEPLNISDIKDGSEYVKVKAALAGQYDVVLLWNTDGVSLSRSSKSELYPILAVPCEVPPQLRSLFVMVLGIWCDTKKPDMNLFLQPFSKSLEKLYNSGGVTWTHPESKEVMKSLVVAPILCADAPAKAVVLNVQQYNAKYGCNVCEQKAKIINIPLQQENCRERRKRRFVFQENLSQLRSGDVMDHQAITAEQRQEPYRGVKGKAVISKIPFLDRGVCTCAEYLHNLLLGVVKYLTNILFYKKGPWYIGDHVNEIDGFIENSVQVPYFVNRCPRGLSHFKFWKGSELRSWHLFYSLPALKPFLPDEYFQHWLLLVSSSYYLLQDKISQDDLAIADVMLRCFVRDVGDLYGYECYTYNVHNLLHLCLQVKRWGPLWSTSAFLFESINGYLRDLIHGTKNLGQELANNIRICLGLQVLRNVVEGFLPTVPKLITEEVKGKPINSASITLTNYEEATLVDAGFTEYVLYKRAKRGSLLYSSKGYDEDKRRCNSLVQFKSTNLKGYGQILHFLERNKVVFCLIQLYKVEHTSIFFHFESGNRVKHLIPVLETENIVLIPLKNINAKLIRAGKYLCHRPNSYEVNL